MHRQPALSVALQHGVQVRAQVGARMHRRGQRQARGPFARQPQHRAQQRFHEKAQAHRAGGRIAGQADVQRPFAQARAQQRLARANRHAVEAHVRAARAQAAGYEIETSLGHRAGADYQIRPLGQHAIQRGGEAGGIVADPFPRHHLGTGRMQAQAQERRVAVVDPRALVRLAGFGQFATGGDQRHPRPPYQRHAFDAERGQQHDLRGAQTFALRQHPRTLGDVLAAAAHVGARPHRFAQADARGWRAVRATGRIDAFDRYHRVQAIRHHRAGHDFPRALARRPRWLACGIAGGRRSEHRPFRPGFARRIAQRQREAVHRGVVEAGQESGTADVRRQHPAGAIEGRHRFGVQRHDIAQQQGQGFLVSDHAYSFKTFPHAATRTRACPERSSPRRRPGVAGILT